MTFSRQLLRSLFVLLGLLALVLVGVVVSQRAVLQNTALVDQDVFVPAVRVERLTAVVQALVSPTASDSLAADVSFEQSCSPRQVGLLTGRLMAALGLDSVFDARQRLGAAFAAAQEVAPVGCRRFLAEVDLVLRSPGLTSPQQGLALSSRVSQALTERVSWESVPPCLYVMQEEQFFYLRGPQGYCLKPDGMRPPGLGTQLSLGASVRQLSNLVYARLLAPQSVSGQASDARRFALTLHLGISQQLDLYAECWSANGLCPIELATPLARTEGATVVVLDAQTGDVLGLRCFGAVCNSDRLSEAQPLGAALLEAPPASVAKLFFSLALAELPVPPKELLFQIKTSGQLDATVVKRNEWWERTALCDLQSRPLGAGPHSCSVPARALQIAGRFGWNAGCAAGVKDCGRVTLSSGLASLPGFMGLIQPVVVGEGATRAADRTYLNWNDYNRIRASGGITQIGQPYRESSAAVQAVLGAAESRTSALGLASLASGLYRVSRGQSPQEPSLIRFLDPHSSALDARERAPITASSQRQQELRSLAAPARLVRQGMAKVLTPAEQGWLGDGTGHQAFLSSFGRHCPAGCPVEGKTGTVSARDPRFAATTTFTGLVEVNRLRSLLGVSPGAGMNLPPALAIGVIVFSANPSPSASGHAASHLAMRLVRDLVVTQAAVDPEGARQ
jgi:hypothetical protein